MGIDISRTTVTLDIGTDESPAEAVTWSLGPRTGFGLGDVVICHGTPWSSRMWLPLAKRLARDHRVLLWDMPGYGDSITPAEAAPPVDLVAQRRRLAALIDDRGLKRPHVIAHDIGGAVALGAHLFEGVDFASIHLSDIVTLTPWGSPFFRLVAENEEVFAALPLALHRALVHAYIAGAAGPHLPAGWVDELARPWSTPHGQAAFYRQIAALSPAHTAPITARLGAVRAPVRISWGEADPWIPVEQADRLAAALPGDVDLTRFPEVGHLAVLEAPAAFAAEVKGWLSSAGDP
ncbi:alpha/beta hydrolase [Brevibacterium ammoniilyticum]|uniref:Alpha/beta hydrolase n=1 Tax=Brevibacterium ammoniilyticum TaxID=1046555 RepID=A0ABP9U072_9MICO